MLLRDSIYQRIRHAILTCEFQPGQDLREQELAERYQVSRSPVRDSLLRLEQEKLMMVLPRQGYRVTPINIDDVNDIFDLRLLIEPVCAAAAARADDAALSTLDQYRGFADTDFDASSLAANNVQLHCALADLWGNRRMAAVLSDLIEHFERVVQVVQGEFDHEAVRPACQEHEAIIDAVQAHDADRASHLVHQHAALAQARILTALHSDRDNGVAEAGAPIEAKVMPSSRAEASSKFDANSSGHPSSLAFGGGWREAGTTPR